MQVFTRMPLANIHIPSMKFGHLFVTPTILACRTNGDILIGYAAKGLNSTNAFSRKEILDQLNMLTLMVT
jgi:hypothetical protein